MEGARLALIKPSSIDKARHSTAALHYMTLMSLHSSSPSPSSFTYAEVDAGRAADGVQALGTVAPRVGGCGVLIEG